MEWVGTGLAVQHLYHPSHEQLEYYGITHVASDRLLTGLSMWNLVEAALWLRFLNDLTDWTQPAELLQREGELLKSVHQAREQAIRHYVRTAQGRN